MTTLIVNADHTGSCRLYQLEDGTFIHVAVCLACGDAGVGQRTFRLTARGVDAEGQPRPPVLLEKSVTQNMRDVPPAVATVAEELPDLGTAGALIHVDGALYEWMVTPYGPDFGGEWVLRGPLRADKIGYSETLALIDRHSREVVVQASYILGRMTETDPLDFA